MQLSMQKLLSINNHGTPSSVWRHHRFVGEGKMRQYMRSTPLQQLCSKLEQNSLTEFELGFSNRRTDIIVDGAKRKSRVMYDLESKRDIDYLIRIVQDHYLPKVRQDKYTCLDSIQIGWQLPRPVIMALLHDVLPLLFFAATLPSSLSPSEYSLHDSSIKRLKLILADSCWIPEATFRRLICSCTQLESLDIQSTRILRRVTPDCTSKFGSVIDCIVSPQQSPGMTSGPLMVPETPVMFSSTLTTLQLIDCDVRTAQVEKLCIHLYQASQRNRYGSKSSPLKVLSLRHNRSLCGTHRMFTTIFQLLPDLESLDVSLCDFSYLEGICLVEALRDRLSTAKDNETITKTALPPLALRRLIVAGNYRLGHAVPDLVEVVCARDTVTKNKIQELDLSFCDVQNLALETVFKHLANASSDGCCLQTFRLQGCRIKKENVKEAFVKCIRRNPTIRNLMLHPPADSNSAVTQATTGTTNHSNDNENLFPYSYPDPYALDTSTLIAIGEALPYNYHLETLCVGYLDTSKPTNSRSSHQNDNGGTRSPSEITEDWRFWLKLNRCGRRVLLNTSTQDNCMAWSTVLANAARHKDPTTLFWLVQQGADHF